MTMPTVLQQTRFQLFSLITLLFTAFYLITSPPQEPHLETVPLPSAANAVPAQPEASQPVEQLIIPQELTSRYQIQPGDTLSGIFALFSLTQTTLAAILEADGETAALDTLQPGNTLVFTQSVQNSELQQLSLIVNPARTVQFTRTAEGTFQSEEIVKPTYWHQQLVSGVIDNSFYNAAHQAGLSDRDTLNTLHILQEKINFRREIRPGDWFDIVLEQEMTGTEATGQTRIKAILFGLGKTTQSAFLYDDGSYYDQDGQSLTRSLRRYPVNEKVRVSSSFNLHRVHPVTGQLMPHYGVDFAMPVGTPVLSVGDGIVTRTANHPYAGKYVEIEHPGPFKTRYLHLSKILVKRGQRIKRGDKIALSGNTGRTTGPHLHFELQINNRPVNPLTAKIPTSSHIPAEEMARFKEIIEATQTFIGDAEGTHLAFWQQQNSSYN
ncbi:peptidoglycan DD-metalloendopeptidase family protein [Gynuella sunshinyii]|uniref:Membrane protein-like metalloendopeptidase n=1 Tax=Gynuella sunshinyii YC6258 TaxID=1445510 RepID=A0A0C5VSL7_9GAMM|nr:peptidoglycan DD-metalloendopeptidase family protein [Gynuella sunshinyii]AJQ93259.1 membrane protein-like metalloendopeptidase [Gynuella sunshinyii YC6258]